MPVLTLQQLRVVLQLAAGCGYKQAAVHLGISVHTVRLHIVRISLKLEGHGSPKDKVLRNAERLIAAQTIELLSEAKAA